MTRRPIFSILKGKLSAFARQERGSILVETAIITPLLISLSAGVFEFGNLFYQKLLVEGGLRDASRYLARCPSVYTCETYARNLAVYGNVTGTGNVRVNGWATGDISFAYATFAATDASGNQLYRSEATNVVIVQVSTTFSYTGVGLLEFLGLSPVELSASHEERKIGW